MKVKLFLAIHSENNPSANYARRVEGKLKRAKNHQNCIHQICYKRSVPSDPSDPAKVARRTLGGFHET